MHLDIGLPLLSELEQLHRAFWQNHNNQNHPHDQDKTLDSHEQTQQLEQQRQRPDHRQTSDNCTEPQKLIQILNQNAESHSERQQCAHNHNTRTEHNHLNEECSNHSPDQKQTSCRFVSTDKNGSEAYEHNNCSDQPKTQQQASQLLQVNDTLLGRCNRPRRTCKVLWDRTTEESSIL